MDRSTRVALTFVLTALVTLAIPSMLGAARAEPGGTSLSFVSEPGDYIGQGQSLTFTPDDGSVFNAMASQDNGSVGVRFLPPGSFWYLHLAAPAGQPLVPGVYEGARRFQSASDPGLDFFGDGRGCNMLTGRFEVLEAVYGPLGYVERFHATFEQHCEEAEPALFGEVRIVNPPPPPALAISLGIDPDGGVRRTSGVATIGGTVACSAGTTLNVSGTLMQRTTRFAVATGWFYASASCSEVPSSWSVEIVPSGDVPFGAGPAEARVTAVGFDPNYGTHVTTDVTSLIRLTGGQR